jgi:hypothetical protein
LNATGELLGENNIYQLDIFHFYAVTSDTTLAYEYTPPYPSSLDPLIGELLSYQEFLSLLILPFFFIATLLAVITIRRKPH